MSREYKGSRKVVFLAFSLLGAGFLLGRFTILKPDTIGAVNFEKRGGGAGLFGTEFPLVNPLLECNEFENISNKRIFELKAKVNEIVRESSVQDTLSYISVYFRDLNNGPWFGINEKDEFIPGSLTKVPFLMALFKEAERNHGLLKEKIFYEGGRVDAEPYFESKQEITSGKTYTVSELVRAMIQHSDNNATLLLSQIISLDKIKGSYSDLGISTPKNGDYSMQVRTYASFFRILFNATYLTKDFSDQALRLLTETDFNSGLVAGMPASTTVAHKFGERTFTDSNQKQLHDCGIVYYPNQPYVLCVMTRGSDYDKLAGVIANISKVVYETVKGGGVE
ncbi:MAG: serine hydrolase [Candidatus Magasanikbacteria bacterium]|nr:serine hydrolase [Candidatus Magasanikbacteria bacterium]